jgi:hypothetical protein
MVVAMPAFPGRAKWTCPRESYPLKSFPRTHIYTLILFLLPKLSNSLTDRSPPDQISPIGNDIQRPRPTELGTRVPRFPSMHAIPRSGTHNDMTTD